MDRVANDGGDLDATPRVTRWAAAALGVGALGVVVTSALYAVAGPEAALPGAAAGLDSLRGATAQAAPWMRWAGHIGMPSDALVFVGAAMLAGTGVARRSPAVQSGWWAVALSAGLFTIVDALVSMVLPAAAAHASGAAAYEGLRALFDGLFSIGGWTLGYGVWAAARACPSATGAGRWLVCAMRASGAVGVGVNVSYWMGGPGASLIGPAVALSALTVGAAALVLARAATAQRRAQSRGSAAHGGAAPARV